MKRKLSMTLLCLFLCAGLVIAAGDAADPLVSLSYLNSTYTQQLDSAIEEYLAGKNQSALNEASGKLQSAVSSMEVKLHSDYAPEFRQVRLNQGDTVAGITGMSFLLLAGEAAAYYTEGAVIDVTLGEVLPSGSMLQPYHRYLCGEDTSVVYTITSKTAVAEYEGYYLLTESPNTVQYTAMADAMKLLGLFKGSDTGFGEGFDLEAAPTRIQALIMLLRSLGEEEAALACTDTHPYQDVPSWCNNYVAYAHKMGYTNGISPTEFGPNNVIPLNQFVELMLRSLGYSVAGVDDYTTSPERARQAGIFTPGEYFTYTSTDFLRADCVYMFYYLLDVPLKDSYMTLGQRLIQGGAFDYYQLLQAQSMVTSFRIA